MSFAKQIAKVQNLFGASKVELTIVSLVLSGLIIGQFVTMQERDNLRGITEQLASYDGAVRSSFIGIDNEGRVNRDLAQADTIIEKESKYPKSKPKQEPVGLININTASKVELMKLKGVGEKTAQKIIDYRKVTPFKQIEDIMNIKGIGPKKFEKMKDNITI
jgi:competence protein ComEA